MNIQNTVWRGRIWGSSRGEITAASDVLRAQKRDWLGARTWKGSFTVGDPDDEWRFYIWCYCESIKVIWTVVQFHVYSVWRDRKSCSWLYVLNDTEAVCVCVCVCAAVGDNVNVLFCCKQGQLPRRSRRCHSSTQDVLFPHSLLLFYAKSSLKIHPHTQVLQRTNARICCLLLQGAL